MHLPRIQLILLLYVGHRGPRAAGSGVPNSRFSHSLKACFKEKQGVVNQKRNVFQSGQYREDRELVFQRLSPKGQNHFTNFCKENVGQSSLDTCRWALLVKLFILLGLVISGVLLAQGSPPFRGQFWFSGGDALCTGVFCLS